MSPQANIISHAESDGDEKLGYLSLGNIVDDVWGEDIKKVRKGFDSQRQYVYVTLKRIEFDKENNGNRSIRLQDSFSDFTTPQDWKMILDKLNSISFIQLSNWAFDNNRASIELAVSQTNKIYLTVRAHENETISSDFDSSFLSVKTQISSVLNLSDRSSICNGVSQPHGENLEALAPHRKGSCKDLTADADSTRHL